jgi:tRNA(Ile)-lysidine synthase
MLSVKRAIDKYRLINKGDVICCAVSGGSDSMALLHFMLSLRGEYGFGVICANVDHGIRGEQSRQDSAFVEEYCKARGVPFYFLKADAPKFARDKKIGIEEAARQIRYGFFYSLLEKKVCDKVFTAHNQNDNAETILFNILRGSGSKGVCGMETDNGMGIIRPMLFTPKAEIKRYVAGNNIAYRTDSTNADNRYTRNYIRNVVLPLIEKRFVGAVENITRLGEIIKEETVYIDNLSKQLIAGHGGGYYISLPADDVLLKRAAKHCMQALGAENVTSANLNDIASLKYKENGNIINAGGGICAFKEYDKIYLAKQDKHADIKPISFKAGEVTLGGYQITAEELKPGESIDFSQKNTFYIDKDKAGANCVYRFRKRGDSFKRFKGGRKSLSDYLTDVKAPKRTRDSLPLLCDGGNVLVLFPYDISDDVKVNQNTKTVYKITYRRIHK